MALSRKPLLPRNVGDQRKPRVGPSSVSLPTLAVVNVADDVAPLGSIEPLSIAMPTKDARIIEYPGELGVCLQHLGILIGVRRTPKCGRKLSLGSGADVDPQELRHFNSSALQQLPHTQPNKELGEAAAASGYCAQLGWVGRHGVP
jgi:hypothetical protein